MPPLFQAQLHLLQIQQQIQQAKSLIMESLSSSLFEKKLKIDVKEYIQIAQSLIDIGKDEMKEKKGKD